MTISRFLAAGWILGLLVTATSSEAKESERYVIGSGWERAFLDMTGPGPGGFPGKWQLDGVSIEESEALARYQAGERRVVLRLVHPSTAEKPLAATLRFAIVAGNDVPINSLSKDFLIALEKRIRLHEKEFRWLVAKDPKSSTALREGPSDVGEDSLWEPQIPRDAKPVGLFRQWNFRLPSDETGAWKTIRTALVENRNKEASRYADSMVKRNPTTVAVLRAAAAVFRVVGSGGRASTLLRSALTIHDGGKPGKRDSNLVLELAASLFLDGKGSEARKVLNGDLAGERTIAPPCREAEALKVLVGEDLAAVARNIAPPLDGKSPRCVVFLHLNIAHGMDDDAGLDTAVGTAMKRYPDDKDLLYFWGYHYFEKLAFDPAISAWKRLVDLDPLYPAVTGQYGSAMLAAGRLDTKGIKQQLDRLKEKPKDPVISFLAGMGYYYQRNYAKARPLLEVMARAMPHETRGRLYLAMSHYFLGDRQTAEEMFEAMGPYAYHDPDVYYCRSLIYRKRDLPRAIREMQKFVDVFVKQGRLSFGQNKVKKALSDLERMKKGEIPELNLPTEPLQPAL